MRPWILIGLAALALGPTACNQPPAPAPSPAAASQTSPATASSSAFGAPITSGNSVLLADLARDPARWQGQPVVVTGTVADVCQHMGCWMVVEDGGQKARVRMHDHAFFVPKDCKGRKARIQGLVAASAAPAKPHECAHAKQDGEHHECPKDQPGELSFDATGVELL